MVMFNRLYFPLIALFWIIMNLLLWRAEFGGGKEFGSAVPTEAVWQKILTAPDDSTLEISSSGKRIGYCRWGANAGEELAAGKISRQDYSPEGMVKQLSHYTIDLEGNVLPAQPATRVRFSLHLEFATDHAWRELSVRVATRPSVWTIHATAADQRLDLKYEDETGNWTRAFAFDELRDPRKWIEEFAGPLPPALLGPAAGLERQKNLSPGLKWTARNDWLKIGHSRARVYRLQAQLLGHYEVVVIVSRVGEILRVELPNGLLLLNEALTNL
ncbi:MAG: hypothetical protein DME18_02725 [Verrucomicrobia bacterium]|nr:MAG: hypothetical protein DME18_02725 [Verrucomicrobiota bacterium]